MRSTFRVWLLLCATAFSISAQSSSPTGAASSSDDSSTASPSSGPERYIRPDAKTRQDRYLKSILGPYALGEDVALAGFNTWRNSPEEWGPTWKGFGKRVASNLGKSAIRHSIQFGLDEALKLDSHYYRSKDKSVTARIKNALLSDVTARTETGKRTVGIPRLVGTYTASIIAAETWYPSRYDWKDGVKNATYSLGFNAGFNLLKEFFWKK